MRLRGSRYESVKTFAPGDDGSVAFPGLRARDIGPAIGALEHTVAAGDRLDLLALQYYNDTDLTSRPQAMAVAVLIAVLTGLAVAGYLLVVSRLSRRAL